MSQVDEGQPGELAGSFSAGGEHSPEWRHVQGADDELARTDAEAAALQYMAAARAAAQAGEAAAAVQLARSAMLSHARKNPSLASTAASFAVNELASVSSTDTWLHEASGLQIDMSAVGLTGEAIQLARTITAVTRDLPPSTEGRAAHAHALVNLASALAKAGRHAEALPVLADAADQAPRDAYELIGNLEYALGLAHAELNHIADARQAYARARAAFTAAGADPIDLAYVDRQEAAALARTGRYDEALPLFERAHATFAEHGKSEDVDRTFVGLVQARYQLGRPPGPEDLDEFEATALRLSPSESVAMGLNLANIAHRQHDDSRADRLYQTFAKRARDMGMPVDAAKFDSSYAVVLRDRGQLDAALTLNRSAAGAFAQAGMLRELANADLNHALLLEEQAKAALASDEQRAVSLRDAAADSALAAVSTLDKLRHSLPEAADRRALLVNAYPQVFTIAIAACFRASRFDEVAALVEKSRVQPVLRKDGAGFIDPAPVAARRSSPAVGGNGATVVLVDLAVSQLGPGSAWLGWWSDGHRLVRCRSRQDDADVESGPFDASAMNLLAAALPVVLPGDEAAADGDQRLAQLIALWRSASGPLLNDPGAVGSLEKLIPRRNRAQATASEAVTAMAAITCDELLWPLSFMLFADTWRADLVEAATAGTRLGVVVAPPPIFGRVPWAALPLGDPHAGPVLHLVDAADVLVGLPASLAAGLHRVPATASPRRGTGVVVADSLGDLPYARGLSAAGMTTLGPAGSAPATKEGLISALNAGQEMLIINGHVRPGSAVDPASSALILISPGGQIDAMTVEDFADIGVPPQCVILGCDGAGAATGTEWTGLVTGLVWAGARQVVTTTVPVVEDSLTATLDAELLDSIRGGGAVPGLLNWQRSMAARWRDDPSSPASAPYRWAETVAVRSGGP
jgi:tetratricopeptide (TPR) repeat protein